MKKLITFGLLSIIITSSVFFTSCTKEYAQYDNMEVLEDTYSGSILITSTGSNPGGDFIGSGDSGKYSFVWDNPNKTAQLNYDITTTTGSVQFIMNDAKGEEVLNETRVADGNDTFSGISNSGKDGKWLITIILTDFEGDGSFSVSPGD